MNVIKDGGVIVTVLFVALIVLSVNVHATQAKEECATQYATCIEKAYPLPGGVDYPDSPFYKAWRACSAANAICEFGPAETPTTPTTKNNELAGIVTSIAGTVEISKDRGKTFTTATAGTRFEEGNLIMTGGRSSVKLRFSYGDLTVEAATNLRIDKYVNQNNIKKAQLYLNVGTVKAIIKKVANVRSDFSVQTNTTTASIRGSEMVVVSDKKKGITKIYAVAGTTYWKLKNKKTEHKLAANKKIIISAGGHVGQPASFAANEPPSS